MFALLRRQLVVYSLLFSWTMLACYSPAPAKADELPEVQYLVDLTDAKNHYVHIQMRTTATNNQTQLMMAVWTPGSYLVREYARHIDSLEVTDGAKQPLPFKKIRKNRWSVETTPEQEIVVSYRLYCNEVSVRTNFVNHRFGVLNGAPTFLTIPQQMDQPHQVTLKLPKAWRRSATSLNRTGQEHTFVAANFDELVDSPIVAGLVDTYSFEAGGVEHQLVNVGESGYWDGKAVAADLKKIVDQHQQMWGTVPYDRYLFMNVIAEGRGGLEHDYCNLTLASRWAFRIPEKYQDWLSLASHEFFHTWNVRRLRPKPLLKYDYENEIYTDSLWVAEGITSYYEDLALVRSGLIDRKEYLKRLSKNIEKVQSKHGRNIQSLRDASFDTWIKFYRPDENSSNTRVSYYDKGAIVAFLLDAKIREVTQNERCLDDVMQAVYQKFQKTGYTQAGFRAVASEVANHDLDPWFQNAIDSTNELDYGPALDWLGLEFTAAESDKDKPTPDSEPKESATDQADEKASEDKKPDLWLGLKMEGNRVTSVKPLSPAFEAGFNPKDNLIAINGFSIHESLETHLKQFNEGEQIEVMVSRRGQLLTLKASVALKPESNWKLGFLDEPSEDRQKNADAWLR